jgi:ADP-ribose pyrophosphatase
MSYELLNSEVVYPGRAFTVRRDTLRLPNGCETRYDIVEHPGSVIILPLDDQGNILFVRQYRHAAGFDLLELPAGVLDVDEDAEACARRELREETGMAAGQLDYLGGFFLAPGYSTEYMHVYLASDLKPAPLEADSDEFLTVEAIPVAKALAMAKHAEMPDAKSLAALLMSQVHLKK